MKDRFVLLATELAQLELRRREILRELKSRAVRKEQRQLVLGILGEPAEREFDFDGPRPLSPYLSARRNMLAEIRNLLASKPEREFGATQIKADLEIDRSNEKSFYSALAKLHKLGQIQRVGRALYKSSLERPKGRKLAKRSKPPRGP
jgi:hypothetical protein